MINKVIASLKTMAAYWWFAAITTLFTVMFFNVMGVAESNVIGGFLGIAIVFTVYIARRVNRWKNK